MKTEILHNSENFFCVIHGDWANAASFTEWYIANETTIKEKLNAHGVVCFRQTSMQTHDDFNTFIAKMPAKSLNYMDGNSPRTKLSSTVYTSTEYPADAIISMHNELSYSNYYPNHIFFYCLTPSKKGGETTILNGNTFIQKLDTEIMGDFFQRNIKYIRTLHGGSGMGPSWQETYETDDKEKVEIFCKANGIKTFWKQNNKLRLEQIRPTIITHPETGKKVWFNQADQFHPSNNSKEVYEAMKMLYTKNDYPLYVCYEDDSEIPETIFDHIRKAYIEHTVKFPWEKGNLMLVDNVATLHGRSAFEGERKILISMT